MTVVADTVECVLKTAGSTPERQAIEVTETLRTCCPS
jgi:hypothetical protein